MIYTEAEIKDIILKNPNKLLVDTGKKYNKEMRKHFYGEHLEAALTTIDGMEKETMRNLRVKYANSNKDLFSRLSRPIDKVFSARGGSIYYNLPETQEKMARTLAMDVKGGRSVKKWIENFWRQHYLDDPYGITFMEIAQEQKARQLYSQGKSFVYPTYKSIQCIYDYLPNGSNLDYVCFTVNAADKLAAGFKPEDKIFRFVDDAMDYFVQQTDAETVIILKEHSLPNLFMYVPGKINSDIPDPNLENGHLSLFNDILELANTFLLKGSIKLTHEFLFAFPKYWEYADDCGECNGTTLVNGETCKKCKGSGKSIMSKVSDAKLITWPQSKDDAIVTPNVAGYVSPDKIYWEISTNDLQLLEDLQNYTIWGASNVSKIKDVGGDVAQAPKTATEINAEIKPQSDRLAPISECAENHHKFILDSMIRIQVNQNYKGSSVNYGKRYIVESPDVIWEKYSNARTKGAAVSILDDLLMEYYEAKYNSDPVKLAIQTKLMKVEPFVHLTTTQLKGLGAGDDDYKAKLYFSEWLSTMNDAVLISTDIETLKTDMYTYTGTRKLADKALLPAA